jgi:hypothetical protein
VHIPWPVLVVIAVLALPGVVLIWIMVVFGLDEWREHRAARRAAALCVSCGLPARDPGRRCRACIAAERLPAR